MQHASNDSILITFSLQLSGANMKHKWEGLMLQADPLLVQIYEWAEN